MGRAVIVSPNPASEAGGVERVCALLAQVLEEDGWEVSVVGPRRTMGRWRFRLALGYLGLSLDATAAAREHDPDLLITNGLLGFGSSRKTPRIHLFHGTMVADTRAEGRALSRRERLRRTLGGALAEALAGRGATVVSVAHETAREVRRYYGLHTDAVIPNGVDTALFRPQSRQLAREALGLPPDARLCLFVGRMQHRKGAELLAPACREAGYELMTAGAGDGAGDRHLGLLAPQELAGAYAAADCVLYPSRYEACGLVALEALACGVPLLATRVGWMPTFLEAVPGYSLLSVRPEHDDIVARLRLLQHTDTSHLMRTARAWIERHNSLESWGAAWRELIMGVLP
jgi:glycosyltransferase involved in cell wall biosynthesis